MKGISYITDDSNKKKSIVIDFKTIEKHEEEVHEFIDLFRPCWCYHQQVIKKLLLRRSIKAKNYRIA